MPDAQNVSETGSNPSKIKLLWTLFVVFGALALVAVLGSIALHEPEVAEVPRAAAVAAPDTEVTAAEPKAQEVAAQPIGTGKASYYGPGLAGNPTASGEPFDPKVLTAAHRTLPFGSRVRVTNAANGASVVVRINDRGPFAKRRIIDVSRAAARRLGMIEQGIATVHLELLSTPAKAK